MEMRQNRRKFAMLAAGAFFLTLAADAGEKVQLKGSTELELPKPTRNYNPDRKYKVDDDRPSLEGGFVAPAPIEGSMLLDKRTREMLDKKKNWIFVNPYEDQYDSKTSEFLKGEKGSGLFSNRLMQDEEKSQVEKFMEEKNNGRTDPNSEPRDKSGDNSDRPDRPRKDGQAFGADSDRDEKSDNRPSPVLRRDSGIQGLDRKPLGERVNFATGFERPERDGIFDRSSSLTGRGSELSAASQLRIKEQERQHDAEFSQFLQNGRSTGASLGLSSGIRLDPLNRIGDTTRIDATPGVPGRTDALLNAGRGEPTIASVSAAAPPVLPNAPSRSSVEDITSRTIARPANVFSPAGTSFTPPETPSFTASPFQLPFPKRKF